jgi:DNA replication protein DnaC
MKQINKFDLTSWISAPTLVSEDEHLENCASGFVYNERNEAVRCPICEVQRRFANLDKEMRESGIGDRYLKLEWNDLEMVAPMNRVKKACENIHEVITGGHCALLWGAPGAGKTQSAVLLVKSALKAGYKACIENLGRLCVDIRSGYSGEGSTEAEVLKKLSNVDLLVLDDIGAGETSNALVEKRILYFVLEARQNQKKPTVVTTNLTPHEVTNMSGTRIIGRLQPLTYLEFNHGKNFRKPKPGTPSPW